MYKKYKIFFLLKNINNHLKGAEKAQLHLINYFANNNHYHTFVYLKTIEQNIKNNLVNNPNVTLIFENNYYLKLLLCVNKYKPDIFFSWIWKYNLLVSPVAKKYNILNICFNHGFYIKELKIFRPKISKLEILVQKYLYKYTLEKVCDLIFVPSHDLIKYLSQIISKKIGNKIYLQYLGIVSGFSEVKYKRKINKNKILYLGGFQEHKGIYSLLNTAKINPDIIFYIYGDINTINSVDVYKKIKEEKIKNIIIKGYSNKLDQVYPDFDILYYPSKLDNLPLSVLEAMKFGLIVVTTKIGELKYIIKDGINGIVCSDKAINMSILKINNLSEISKNALISFNKNFTYKVYNNLCKIIKENI